MSAQERRVPEGRLANFDTIPADDPNVPTPSLPPRRPARTTPSEPAPTRTEPTTTADASLDSDLKGPGDRVKPSNVHVSVDLVEPFSAWCQRLGLSHGEGIIYVLEATSERLPNLINPPATAGGNLFASRRSHPIRPAEGPRTPLNYRMRAADFAILDDLVEQFGATSRGHLISTAIAAYLKTSNP